MPENNQWSISIPDQNDPNNAIFGGLVPSYFSGFYPFFGNKNQAATMRNIDLTDPNVIGQGIKLSFLQNGHDAQAVNTLIRGIQRYVSASDLSYAVGVAKLYQITSTTVISNATFPHTISKTGATVIDAEDVALFKGKQFYSFNVTTGSPGIGKYDPDTGLFDDNYMAGYQLEPGPHQIILGGDDVMYFANGRYVGYLNAVATTGLSERALDFWQDAQVASITWNENRIKIALNRPNVTGANQNQSGIYTWNGYSPSWEGDPIEVNGKIGALYTKNGITFCWWQESGQSNRYTFGYLSGGRTQPIKTYQGTLPLWYQVGEYKGFIAWISDGLVWLWGSGDEMVPIRDMQYAESSYVNSGGLASTFGELLVASKSTASTTFEKPQGEYTQTSYYKTKAFPVNLPGYKSQIDLIQIDTEQLSQGQQATLTLTYNKGSSMLSLSSISYATPLMTSHKVLYRGQPALEDFRLDLDFVNSTTKSQMKIRKLMVNGHFTQNT